MKDKILILDNYDSFTYNLVHVVEYITGEIVTVKRNDEIEPEAVNAFDKIILSPGPGVPSNAGLMPEILKRYAAEKSILGVCLGHQAIAECFGGSLHNLSKVYHGLATPIHILQQEGTIFEGLEDVIEVGRYHSWIVNETDLPDCLQVTAKDEAGHIMAFKHKTLDVEGVQFHPESILTPQGEALMRNWLKIKKS